MFSSKNIKIIIVLQNNHKNHVFLEKYLPRSARQKEKHHGRKARLVKRLHESEESTRSLGLLSQAPALRPDARGHGRKATASGGGEGAYLPFAKVKGAGLRNCTTRKREREGRQ